MSGVVRPGVPGRIRRIFRRDKVTGQIAIGLAGVLAVTAVVYGVGVASAKYDISDVGAWLTSRKTKVVVHANGLAGKVDGKASLIPGMVGHRIKVVQDGNTVLLIDQDSGVVSRIDPTQLRVAQSRAMGVGLQVEAGADTAYTLDSIKGTVQRIDPVTLSAVGAPTTLTPPLEQAGIDGRGVLWVPTPQTGQAVPFQGGRQQAPVTAGKAGDRLKLSIAAGTPVILNSSDATALILRPAGSQKINLPTTVKGSVRWGGVFAPPTSENQTVPVLGPKGALILLDTGVGRIRSHTLPLPDHKYQAPNLLGSRVYIPDRTTGSLIVFNTATRKFEKPVPVTRPGGAIEVIVKDQLLWANDPDGPFAVAFDPSGAAKKIKKYDDKVPGGPRRPIPTQGQPGGNRGNQNNGGGRGNNGGGVGGGIAPQPGSPQAGQPTPTPAPSTPPPWEAPTEPQNVMAEGADGSITVSFGPAVGGTPLGYTLKGQTQGFQVSPARIEATGPDYRFTLTGGSCDQEYTFSVAVLYEDKNKKQREKVSVPTQPARPCVAPGAPSGFVADGVNHGANLRWNAAPGKAVTYALTGQNAPATVTSTSAAITGLANARTYPYTLRARNGAGESGAGLTATADLNYRRATYQNKANNQTNTIIRPGPTKSGEVGRIAKGTYRSLVLICQVKGQQVREAETGETSNWWNRIEWNGGVGYLSVTLMQGPRQPGGKTFEC